ncbi:MAG: hypothetical protein NHB32_17235 [Fischerella sp. CENA71]|nr:hypothetical protein [Fischerella sp. CENA71]
MLIPIIISLALLYFRNIRPESLHLYPAPNTPTPQDGVNGVTQVFNTIKSAVAPNQPTMPSDDWRDWVAFTGNQLQQQG